MKIDLRCIRWLWFLLIGLAWATTECYGAADVQGHPKGSLSIGYDGAEIFNHSYDAAPRPALDDKEPGRAQAMGPFVSVSVSFAAREPPIIIGENTAIP